MGLLGLGVFSITLERFLGTAKDLVVISNKIKKPGLSLVRALVSVFIVFNLECVTHR